MMTLITRLCVLCAMSALLQMAMPMQQAKGSLRVICGMLMLRLAVSQMQEIGMEIARQRDLMGLFECLMR